jgi:hypothetical protein
VPGLPGHDGVEDSSCRIPVLERGDIHCEPRAADNPMPRAVERRYRYRCRRRERRGRG